MPFDDGSLAAVFATSLPYEIWPTYVREAARTLVPGGLVAMDGVKKTTINQLVAMEYRPIRGTVFRMGNGKRATDYDVIFQKPAARLGC